MGYNTRFHLTTTADSDPVVAERIRHDIEKVPGWDPFEDSVKWYEHEKDMQEVSSAWPAVIFTLEGHGEESGDVWVKYFYGGEVQRCKTVITFEPFDVKKFSRQAQKEFEKFNLVRKVHQPAPPDMRS